VNYLHRPHPRILERQAHPPKTTEEHAASSLSEKIGLKITAAVGTMACAAAFTILALVALPGALSTGQPVVIVAWISQAFLQLVLLSILMVGGNIAAKAADARADSTWRDAEAILHEAIELQKHLQYQDTILEDLIDKFAGPPMKRK
jgi:ABC-type nickel/cobalt efflux system permease component RcnA